MSWCGTSATPVRSRRRDRPHTHALFHLRTCFVNLLFFFPFLSLSHSRHALPSAAAQNHYDTPDGNVRHDDDYEAKRHHAHAVALFKYAIRSARSCGFLRPAKTIFVPVRMYVYVKKSTVSSNTENRRHRRRIDERKHRTHTRTYRTWRKERYIVSVDDHASHSSTDNIIRNTTTMYIRKRQGARA